MNLFLKEWNKYASDSQLPTDLSPPELVAIQSTFLTGIYVGLNMKDLLEGKPSEKTRRLRADFTAAMVCIQAGKPIGSKILENPNQLTLLPPSTENETIGE